MSEPQSKTAQRRIIEAAKADGSLDTLYWYIVIGLQGNRTIQLAVNGWVPVLPVAPDPEVSQHIAHLMLEIHKQRFPGSDLRIELTVIDVLVNAGIQWYEWGTEDVICPECAGIGWQSCICTPTLWRVDESTTLFA